MQRLGYQFEVGQGVQKDLARAVHFYGKAVELDNVRAMHSLGNLYLNGNGVARSYVKAAELYRKALARGYEESAYPLAYLYALGGGVPRDARRAAELAERALRDGNGLMRAEMRKDDGPWPNDFRLELQRRLQAAGVYAGPLDGHNSKELQQSVNMIFGKRK
jgi:TPR repeat protein